MPRRIALVSAAAPHGSANFRLLEEAGFELLDRSDSDASKDEDVLVAALVGAWATVAGAELYSRGVLERLPDLRVIARVGVGYDCIDLEAATDRGVLVLTTPGANAEHVADFALALMLACVRRLVEVDAAVRSGAWRLPVLSGDLAGATVGLVGLGQIGRAVARRLRGFDCRIVAVEPDPEPEFCRRYAVELASLEEVLPQVDVLSLHAPLTPESKGLIGARELGLVRPGVVVVNTARGGLIDEAALVAALRAGRVGGAGLDVFEHEPLPVGHPLTRFPNVVLGGRTSTFTRASMERMTRAAVENILAVDRGEIPPACLNPAAAR
jgi:D-3-phosphoglycerate dehydrogenase / 2-oxoglutarate reductase